jgi:hypothetical protein
VDNGHVLGVRAGNSIDCGKLANTECGEKCGNTLDASVAISCVACRDNQFGRSRLRFDLQVHTGVQLVAVANPLQASLGNIVEGNEVIVSRHAMDGLDTNLLESLEKVLVGL